MTFPAVSTGAREFAAAGTTGHLPDRLSRRWVTLLGALAFALLAVRTAWMSDDAYITFRTVDNFLHGFGLRWNIANRVEVYTNPLWMFLVAGVSSVTGELYYTVTVLSIALSVGTVVLVAVTASSLPMELLAISAMAVSKAFVDFSTSGLENPLTHFLLVAFFILYLRAAPSEGRRVFGLTLLATLLMLNRLDVGLIVIPAVAVALWQCRERRKWLIAVAAMVPLLAWEGFSLIYYGFPLPNTAYAKLATSVPRLDLAHQGLVYLLDSVSNDPPTLLLILAALLSPFVARSSRAISFGILLDLLYIVWVGGDFMSGRFLAAPFVCAVLQLSRQPIPHLSAGWAVAFGFIWVTGLSAPRPVVLSTASFGADVRSETIPVNQIVDERRVYYPSTALLNAHRGGTMPNHLWIRLGEEERKRGAHIVVTHAAGFISYAAGPSVYLVDRWALGDPLLARLPAETPWRIGHFERHLPAGYEETLATRHDVLRDPGVAAFYEKLRIVTEGPIWSRERFRTIWKMNVGGYDSLLASYGLARRRLEEVGTRLPDGTNWDAPGTTAIPLKGIIVDLPRPRTADAIELSVSDNGDYDVALLSKGRSVGAQHVSQSARSGDTLLAHVLSVPHDVQFDAVLARPSGGDARYSLGYLQVCP